MTRTCAGAAFLASVAISGVAAGAEANDGTGTPARVPAVEVGVGGQSAFAYFGDVCWSDSAESETCSPGYFMNGVHLAPRWRIWPGFSAGLLGSASWVTTIEFETHTFVSAEMEGRWHPLPSSGGDPWLGIDGGIVTVFDRYNASFYGPANTRTQTAPTVGVGGGIEFRVASFLTIGPALRAFGYLFNRNRGSDFNRPSPEGPALGVGLSLSGTLLVGPGTQ